MIDTNRKPMASYGVSEFSETSRHKLPINHVNNTSSKPTILSITPPCPGMMESKSLMPYARLIPDAKYPPNGATSEANIPSTNACICMGKILFTISSKWWCTCVGSPLIHGVITFSPQGVITAPCSDCTEHMSTTPGIIFTTKIGSSSKIWGGKTLFASWTMGSKSQVNFRGRKEILLVGHVSHVNPALNWLRYHDTIKVKIAPPMKPSHVLLGERLTNGRRMNFLPHVIPEKY